MYRMWWVFLGKRWRWVRSPKRERGIWNLLVEIGRKGRDERGDEGGKAGRRGETRYNENRRRVSTAIELEPGWRRRGEGRTERESGQGDHTEGPTATQPERVNKSS